MHVVALRVLAPARGMTSTISPGRELPLAEVRERRPRMRRHQVTASVAAVYALAAAGASVVGDPTHRWVAVHLLLLGAASNAILVWSRHFAQALLHARLGSERAAVARLAGFN